MNCSVVEPASGQLKYGFGGGSELCGAELLAFVAASAFGSFVIEHIQKIWASVRIEFCVLARFAAAVALQHLNQLLRRDVDRAPRANEWRTFLSHSVPANHRLRPASRRRSSKDL